MYRMYDDIYVATTIYKKSRGDHPLLFLKNLFHTDYLLMIEFAGFSTVQGFFTKQARLNWIKSIEINYKCC